MHLPNGTAGGGAVLSEAEQLFTQQLLDEAKRATAASRHRGRLSKRRSGSGESLSQVLTAARDS